MRFLISNNQENPIAWEVSKTDDVSPVGIIRVICKQDFFDPVRDNKEMMIADYYKTEIEPPNSKDLPSDIKIKIEHKGLSAVKVGGSYKVFTAVPIDTDVTLDTNLIGWSISGLDDSDYTFVKSEDTFKIKAAKDYNLIDKVFTLILTYDGEQVDSVEVEVVQL